MAAKIQVKPLHTRGTAQGPATGPATGNVPASDQASVREFHVRVIEGASESSHHVTLATEDYDRLTGGKITPEELITRSFQFLLAREPKESILARFDLMVIARYFPSFERDIKRTL
jgi:hypothetical protein